MRFRLGFVAMTLALEDCSPSKTVTVAALDKIESEEGKKHRLTKITRDNLANTLRILRYAEAADIKVYRFTSKLVPLATYREIEHIDYENIFREEFKAIGDFVKEKNMRVSAHPDHYTLINSTSEKVLEASVRDLEYHVKVYEAMGLSDYKYKLVMHIGGLYKDKTRSIERFKENFIKLPDSIRKRIILENDDKSYTAADVLGICKELGVPMVLDVHHHSCANDGESLEAMLPDIWGTWVREYFNPKIHFSSPKSQKDFRSHADDIVPSEFCSFLQTAQKLGRDFDVMLEAKNKDLALLKLSEQLEAMPGIKKINAGEFEIMADCAKDSLDRI